MRSRLQRVKVEVLNPRLRRIVGMIKNRSLRNKVTEMLENPQMKIGGKTYSGLPLGISPGGVSRHHSYPEGLVEHMVATAEIALTLSDVVLKVYCGAVNQDLVIAGVLLHDIFKPLTYVVDEDRYSTTTLGERLDHLTLITAELIRKGFPLNLVHVVCAHHGGRGGPMWPRTVEALICHIADQADSQLNGDILRAARYLSRTAIGEDVKIQSSKKAFEIVNAKSVDGWKGVKKTVEKIKTYAHT